MPPIADPIDTPAADAEDTRSPTDPVGVDRSTRDPSDTGNSRPTVVIRPPAFSIRALGRAVRQLIHYRDLLYTLSLHRVKVRYKQSLLGPLWALLQPLALMLIYTAVFSRIAHVPSEGAPYALFAYTALLPWTYFSTALSNATNSLVSHTGLVTKVYFPREILPLTYVVAALVDFVVASTVLGALMVYYGVPLTARAVYIFPTVAVLTMFAIAVSLVLSGIQARYRDMGVAMPLLLQLWMFATPVVYPLSVVPAQWRPLYDLNPMVGVIESFRRVLLLDGLPDFHALIVAATISIVLLPIAFVWFKRVEATVADVI